MCAGAYRLGVVRKYVFGHARGLYVGRRVKLFSCFCNSERSFDYSVDLAKDLKDLDLK